MVQRIRQTRDGAMNNGTFGTRMVGTGEIASQIHQMFQMFKRKYGLAEPMPPRTTEKFRPPQDASGQGWLF